MPTYRSISIALHSQHDIQTLPEFHPASEDKSVPPLINETTSTCSVHVPANPGSAFWFSYRVLPPVPSEHYFLFKMYINGVHIVNWSTSKDDNWKGKSMFALYERPEDEEGKKAVEKRMLFFTSPLQDAKSKKGGKDLSKMCVEIKVLRAHGRKRVERELQEYKKTPHAKSSKGIKLVDAGSAPSNHPKRFYKFALVDPVDQPFATFRYYYRTWQQLIEMGLIEVGRESTGEENDLSIIEPDGDSVQAGSDRTDRPKTSEDDSFHDCSDIIMRSSEDNETIEGGDTTLTVHKQRPQQPSGDSDGTEQRTAYVLRGTPGHIPSASQRHSGAGTPPEYYRLSTASSARSGTANSTYSPTAYQPHTVNAADDLVQVSKKEARNVSGSTLVDTISSIWTRRNNGAGARGKEKSSVTDR